MNQYEVAVLYDPDLEIDLEKATSRIEKIYKDNGAKILKTDNWGKRKLAYPINKHETAIYVIYSLEIPAENVRKIEGMLNITDEIIRFLITRPDLKAIARAEEARASLDREQKEDESEDKAESKDKDNEEVSSKSKITKD